MNESIPFAQAVSIPEFHYYEELARSELPDNAIVYSKEGKVECKVPERSILNFLGGSTIQSAEVADGKKSNDDFREAMRLKFGDAIENYVFPTKEESEHSHEGEPLTLGQIRLVIKEATLEAYVKEHAGDLSFINNPDLARLTGRAIMAKEQAEEAAAHLDALGYHHEHFEEVLQATVKLLLDAGITAAVLGAASYVALTTLTACAAGIAMSTLTSGIPIMRGMHAGANNALATEGAIGHIIVTEVALTVAMQATLLISPQLAAGHAIIQGIPTTIAALGLTSEQGKQLGELVATFLPNVSSSLEATQQAASKLTEVQKAFIRAVATRVVANELLEEVKKEAEKGTSLLPDPHEVAGREDGASMAVETIVPQELTQLVAKNIKELTTFIEKSQNRFNEKEKPFFKELLEQAEKINGLTQELSSSSSLDQEKITVLWSEAQQMLVKLGDRSERFKSNQVINQLKSSIEKIAELTQKLKTPSFEEIEKDCKNFLNAVVKGIQDGKRKIEKLQNEAKILPPSGEEQRIAAKKKNSPYAAPRHLPI